MPDNLQRLPVSKLTFHSYQLGLIQTEHLVHFVQFPCQVDIFSSGQHFDGSMQYQRRMHSTAKYYTSQRSEWNMATGHEPKNNIGSISNTVIWQLAIGYDICWINFIFKMLIGY